MNQSYSVKAYLDEDTKNLPANVTAARFIGGINTRLQTFDERLTLATATSYGAFPNYGGSQECLTNTFNVDVRFSFTYRPIRYRTCGYCVRSRTDRGEYPVEPYKENLSFLELKEDILRDVDQELQQANSQLSPILICTSDPDFRRLIGILRNDGYKVILFTNLDRDSPLLTEQERALVEAPQLYLHCNNCRKEPWIGVLYAPWCQDELADKLAVAKFRADGDQKEFAQQELKLGSIPTVLKKLFKTDQVSV